MLAIATQVFHAYAFCIEDCVEVFLRIVYLFDKCYKFFQLRPDNLETSCSSKMKVLKA